ncbi:hypothetical protein CRE_21579 [Caenorhabditis remanei]|uniref:Uncharacterized protein n=1 Tax=Caenorhabditis remanei TaxID=31234 RepID=E3NHL4_CAERE|nr:hypothetical protein CRE_21579 [Caenorhabditis remanei]
MSVAFIFDTTYLKSISICCAQIRPTDEIARNYLLQGMQFALKHCNEIGAKTEFVIEPCEGYVDMTIEKGNVEYSFAFFYYNPTICDPTPEDVEMPMVVTSVDEPME